MNRVTRVAAATAVMAAALAGGAATAQASTASPASHQYFIDSYPSSGTCEWEGTKWLAAGADDYYCDPVDYGRYFQLWVIYS